jgi:hypothetical protein
MVKISLAISSANRDLNLESLTQNLRKSCQAGSCSYDPGTFEIVLHRYLEKSSSTDGLAEGKGERPPVTIKDRK